MKKIELLKRDRIDKTLSAIYDYPLTIVEAPMGFSKTTAVRNFLKSEKKIPLWITFLNSGQSASCFWEKFTSKMSNKFKHI